MKIPSVHSQFHMQWSYCPLSQYRNSFLEYPHHCCCCYCLVAKMCPALRTPRSIACQLLCPWNFPGKNTVVGCHFLLQGLFPTQRSNPHLLHWQMDSSPLSHRYHTWPVPTHLAWWGWKDTSSSRNEPLTLQLAPEACGLLMRNRFEINETRVSLQHWFQYQTSCKKAVKESVLIYTLSKQKFTSVNSILNDAVYTQL